jgi:hypothetical protein
MKISQKFTGVPHVHIQRKKSGVLLLPWPGSQLNFLSRRSFAVMSAGVVSCHPSPCAMQLCNDTCAGILTCPHTSFCAAQLYNEHAIQLALLVAVTYTLIALLRLSFVTNFLSHTVIGGFTSGAAIIIGASQVLFPARLGFLKAQRTVSFSCTLWTDGQLSVLEGLCCTTSDMTIRSLPSWATILPF